MGVYLESVYSETFFQLFGQVLKLPECGVLADHDYSFPDWGCFFLQALSGSCLVFFRYVLVYFSNWTFYPLFVAVGEFRTDVVQLLAP